MFKRLSVFILLTLGLFYLSGCGLSDDTVAEVGGHKITKEDFVQQIKKMYPGRSKIDSVAKKSVLDRMIDQELKVSAALEDGLDKDPQFLSDVRMQTARMIGNKYFERVIVDKLFPEETLREYFDKQKDEIKASHILIGYKGARNSTSKLSKEEALKKAQKIAKEAQSGADFEKLAIKYSEDPSAKTNKGNLGYFTWGRMVGPFQEKAFSMKPGEVSDPVETEYGFHIIKVVDRRPNPLYKPDEFEAKKFELKRQLYYTKKDSAMAMWRNLQKELKKKYNLKVLDDNIKKLAELIQTKKNEGTFKETGFTADDKSLVLAEWDGGKFTLGDLLQFYSGRRFSYFRTRLTSEKALKQNIDNLGFQELMLIEAKKMGIDKDPEVQAQIRDFKNSKLSSLAYNRHVIKAAEITDDEVKQYYQEHQNQFKKPAEIEIWEIYVTNKKLAEKIARWAKAGRNFESLAKKYSEDKYYKKKKGYIGYRARNRRGAVSKKAFEVGPNKIAGPVKYRKGWVVLKTGKMKPETVRSFEEAKGQARTRLRNEKIKKLRKSWQEELKKEFTVKINRKALESI